MIWTKAFWKGLGERALKTFIQAAVAATIVGVTGVATVWDVEWLTLGKAVVGVAGMATVLSVLMSLGNARFTAGTPDAAPYPTQDPVPPAPLPDEPTEVDRTDPEGGYVDDSDPVPDDDDEDIPPRALDGAS